jgi:hypothetical protein
MGVSAIRNAACAGVLVGALVLGGLAAAPAFADPGDGGRGARDTESSKGVNSERPSLGRVIQRMVSEHRKRMANEPRRAPRARIGTQPDGVVTTSEPEAATFAEPVEEPAPDPAPDNDRDAGGSGAAGSGGYAPTPTPPPAPMAGGASDHPDTAPVSAAPEPDKKPSEFVEYPFPPYYLLEIRRRGGDWWNAERIVALVGRALNPYLAPMRAEPEPVPAPAPGPAFRGPVPEAPAPEPVLDASGGVGTVSGSDYRATGFGAAPVLSAPVVAMPVPPPAAARFPVFGPAPAPATASAPGLGSAAARGGIAEPEVTARAARQESAHGTAQPGQAVSNPLPRRGYTDYLRSPGLPQLAGAALPGVAGIMLMTLVGGVLGYRQASAGRAIRSSAAARYLP